MHETRLRVIERILTDKRQPRAVEMRQLSRARGMKYLTRSDEKARWEDLDAPPSPQSPHKGPQCPPNLGGRAERLQSEGSFGTRCAGNEGSRLGSQEARLAQQTSDETGAQDGQDEDNVVLPPGTLITSTNFETMIPLSSQVVRSRLAIERQTCLPGRMKVHRCYWMRSARVRAQLVMMTGIGRDMLERSSRSRRRCMSRINRVGDTYDVS